MHENQKHIHLNQYFHLFSNALEERDEREGKKCNEEIDADNFKTEPKIDFLNHGLNLNYGVFICRLNVKGRLSHNVESA